MNFQIFKDNIDLAVNTTPFYYLKKRYGDETESRGNEIIPISLEGLEGDIEQTLSTFSAVGESADH